MTTTKIVFTRGCFVVVGVVMFLLFGCCLCGGLLSLFLWLLLKVVDADVVVTSFSMLSFHGCCDCLLWLVVLWLLALLLFFGVRSITSHSNV